MNPTLSGKTALVTGASSGLGADFARHLAVRGRDLILVARREEALLALADELTKQQGVRVTVISKDLAADAGPQELYDEVARRGLKVDMLVNNAGLGLYGEFLSVPWAKEENMLRIDILALAHLTKLFARDMVARGWGRVLNVASIAAFQPTPLYASYAAAKAYVMFFSEALDYELRGTGVSVSVISPGITKTAFLEVSGQDATPYQRAVMMTSEEVTRIGVEAMLKGKRSVVPGFLNKLTAYSAQYSPHWLTTWLAHRLMKSNVAVH